MKVLEFAAVGAIRAYQWVIRPVLPMSCRYWPSCSDYALEAVRRHGALRGTLLSAWRVLRCNPWGGSGMDPVPARFDPFGRAHRHGADCGSPRHDHI